MSDSSGPQFALGFATLMRLPSRRDRWRVLDAAVDVGIRHTDVAPLYGLGLAEAELGQYLEKRLDDRLVITTKVGLKPSRTARLVGRAQRPLRAAVARSTSLKRIARSSSALSAQSTKIGSVDIHKSAKKSLRDLRVDRVHALLLHETDPLTVTDEQSEAMSDLVASGIVDRWGFAGVGAGTNPPQSNADEFHGHASIIQCPADADLSTPVGVPESFQLNLYGLFNTYLQPFSKLISDPSSRSDFEELFSQDLRDSSSHAIAITRLVHAIHPKARLVIGSTSARHLEHLVSRTSTMPSMDPIAATKARAQLGEVK